jgi:hypothetical protein
VSPVTIGIWALYLSHRIAGPIHRLKRHLLEQAERSNTEALNPLTSPKLQFRKNDFFGELASAFNQYAESKKSEFPRE